MGNSSNTQNRTKKFGRTLRWSTYYKPIIACNNPTSHKLQRKHSNYFNNYIFPTNFNLSIESYNYED